MGHISKLRFDGMNWNRRNPPFFIGNNSVLNKRPIISLVNRPSVSFGQYLHNNSIRGMNWSLTSAIGANGHVERIVDGSMFTYHGHWLCCVYPFDQLLSHSVERDKEEKGPLGIDGWIDTWMDCMPLSVQCAKYNPHDQHHLQQQQQHRHLRSWNVVVLPHLFAYKSFYVVHTHSVPFPFISCCVADIPRSPSTRG